MLVPHFAGSPEQDIDELFTTNNFMDIGIRNSHTLHQVSDKSIELFFGLKRQLRTRKPFIELRLQIIKIIQVGFECGVINQPQ